MQPLCAPVVDEVGDEIDARLIGHHETFLQALAAAQGIRSELCRGLYLVVEAHIVLAEAFHVVHIETHHVSQSVGQEERMGTSLYGLFGVALHKSQFLQLVGHHAANIHVDIVPQHTGACHLKGIVVASLDDGIDFELPLCELSVDGIGTRVVRAIVLAVLGTCITECEATALEDVVRGVAVHNLAMLRENGGKALVLTERMSHTIHLTAHIFLGESRSGKAHCVGVHLVADGTSLLYLGYLDVGLALAHLDDGHNEFYRRGLLLLRRMNAEEVHDLDFGIEAIRWQEVNLAAALLGLVTNVLQLLHRRCGADTCLTGHIADAVDRTVPNDIFDVDVVADKHLFAGIDVDDTNKSVTA